MPASVLQERLAQIVASGNFDVPPENLRICAADLEPDGLPDLASPEAQRYFDRAIADADLILIDNLSTLAPGVRENEADSWVPVQAWALRQRRQGRSVLFVHHAGKGGNQRGTSRKEDVLNTVIALRQPPDYSPSQGARFEVHYEKARGFFGADAQPFEAVLRDGQWTIADIRRGGDDETISTLRQQGLSVREIAERTGVPKSSVDRRLRRLDA
jgi:putative DNA primase/helicase